MIKKYLEWAQHEYSLHQRILVLIPAGILIVLAIPFGLVVCSAAIDSGLGLSVLNLGFANWITAGLFAAAGAFLALWSIQVQMTAGRGTPVPMMPTRKLLVKGPFAYCRNPMTLGTLLAYGGLVIWLGSLSALVLVLILAAGLITYLKLLEEKELVARFGDEYLEYKRSTPFILPHLRRR